MFDEQASDHDRRVSIFEASGDLVSDTVAFTAYDPMGGGNAVVTWTADGFVRTELEQLGG